MNAHTVPVALALVALLGGACATPHSAAVRGVAPIHGRVEGYPHPEHARVEIYRMTDDGIAVRMPGADVVPAGDGRFATGALLPARYLLALRAPGRPVSTVTLPVPPAPDARIVARTAAGGVPVRFSQSLPDTPEVRVVLTRAETGVPVLDRRFAVVRSGVVSVVEGVLPGPWRLDVLGTGWTTTLDVPADAADVPYDVTLPEIGTGAQLYGRVIRSDGSGAPGIAVTVWPLGKDGRTPGPWGRYALTDSDGGYRLAGIPEGLSLLRLECRDAVVTRLPLPERVTIPPSGLVYQSFLVGP